MRALSEKFDTLVNSACELDLAVLERAGRGDGVLQDRADLGQHVGVDVGDLRGQPEVLDQRRDLRVEALEVAVDGLEVLADLVAAALERRRDRVERHVELGGLDRAQQRVEVGEHLLDLGGDLGPLDDGAGLDRLGRAAAGAGSSETYFSPNSVLGTIEPVTLAGIVSVWSGKRPRVSTAPSPLVSRIEDLADDDAADLDVGARRQLQTDLGGLEGDLVVLGELLGEDRVGEVDGQDHQRQEEDAEDLGLAREEAIILPTSPWSSRPRSPSRGAGR